MAAGAVFLARSMCCVTVVQRKQSMRRCVFRWMPEMCWSLRLLEVGGVERRLDMPNDSRRPVGGG